MKKIIFAILLIAYAIADAQPVPEGTKVKSDNEIKGFCADLLVDNDP